MTAIARRNDLLVTAFAENQKIIHSITAHFSRMYGHEFEALIGVAKVATVRAIDNYDPGKGAVLSTWIWKKVWGSLMDYTRNEIKYRHRYHHMDFGSGQFAENIQSISEKDDPDNKLNPREHIPTLSEDKHVFLGDFMDCLTDDAKAIVQLVISSPDEFAWLCHMRDPHTPTAFKKCVAIHLQKKKAWSAEQVLIAIDEICYVLRAF